MSKHARHAAEEPKSRLLLPGLFALVLILCGLIAFFFFRQGPQEAAPAAISAAPAAESAPPSTPAPAAAPAPPPPPLRISEVMAKNRAVLQAEDGGFPDWIELCNEGDEAIELGGWTLSDRDKPGWALPSGRLAPGERLLVLANSGAPGALTADFSLSEGETVYLYSPEDIRADSFPLASVTANHSLVRGADGAVSDCRNATPGYPNTNEGYETFCQGQTTAGPLVIHEVMVSNLSYLRQNTVDFHDWVELRNVSGEELQLSDYYLSDKLDDTRRWQLPSRTLAPGELFVVLCTDDEDAVIYGYPHCDFSLNAAEESLYLSDADGRPIDFVYLRGIPVNHSMGRLSGENGFFYFAQPSPGEDNTNGFRRVSEKPVSLHADGVFDGVDAVVAELQAAGEIFYTLDCSVPDAGSTPYSGPIRMEKTGVLRAVAIEPGALPSPPLTLSYILNEGCSLPVISLVLDDFSAFRSDYIHSFKYKKHPGSMSFYEPGGSFTIACGVNLRGWTSLELPKKSLGVSFRGFGDGELCYDLFSNGVTRFSSLAIRAGQDYPFSVFRNEMLQDLCMEASDHVLTQSSRYSVVFVNGEYWGLYALKEDFSRQYYSERLGIPRSQVSNLRSPVAATSDLNREVLLFCQRNDMSLPENYAHFCEIFDVDSLVDWMILEAYCCNSDVNGNMRYFRDKNGGKWQIAFYDLDWTFRNPGACFVNTIDPSRYTQVTMITQPLLKNHDFCLKLAARTVELSRSVLSNEHVLEKIDEYERLLQAEMPREAIRWEHGMNGWAYHMQAMRDFIVDNDMENHLVESLLALIDLSEEEEEALLR